MQTNNKKYEVKKKIIQKHDKKVILTMIFMYLFLLKTFLNKKKTYTPKNYHNTRHFPHLNLLPLLNSKLPRMLILYRNTLSKKLMTPRVFFAKTIPFIQWPVKLIPLFNGPHVQRKKLSGKLFNRKKCVENREKSNYST